MVLTPFKHPLKMEVLGEKMNLLVFCSDTHILFLHQQQVSSLAIFISNKTLPFFLLYPISLTVIRWLVVTNLVLRSNRNDTTLY